MLHRIILVLTLLVAVGCTGDDTVVREVFCPTLDRVLMEDETCPDPPPAVAPPTTPVAPPTTPDPDTDRGEDCTPVQGVDLTATSQDDIICGNERDNTIEGLTGDDTIYGGPGNDTLIGGDDRDTLKGEAGNDILRGGQDNDILDGGADTDTADYSQEQATADPRLPVMVDLAEGQATDTYMDDDTLISIENVIGTPAADRIIGNGENNKIDGNGGDDTLLDGGAGSDTIVASADFNLATSQAGNDPSIRNFENIEGKLAADATAGPGLTGDDGPNIITGTSLADTLNGAGGNDTLNGGVGVDTLNGDAGNDTLNGGAGDDNLNGGAGNDNLNGGAGADTLIGGAGRDTLIGGEGGDCFQLAVPDIPDAADNNESRGIIRATLDSIRSYGEGDSISVTGATGSVGSGEGDANGDVRVQSGRIVVVIVAAVAADPDSNVVAVAEVSETLANVSGLATANFDTVSTTACATRTP